MVLELCAKVKGFNNKKKKKTRLTPSPSNAKPGTPERVAYDASLSKFTAGFTQRANALAGLTGKALQSQEAKVKRMFMHDCRYDEWKASGGTLPMDRSRATGVNPDHIHDAALDGALTTRNMKWLNARVNQTIGGAVGHPEAGFDDTKHKTIKTHPNCQCN